VSDNLLVNNSLDFAFRSKNSLDFEHIDKIIETGLTKLDYCRILGIIGQSEEPLDNRKIIKSFDERYDPSNKHIFTILKKLCPSNQQIHDDLIFVWEDLIKCDNDELKNKCLKIINKLRLFNIINKFTPEWGEVFYENLLNVESKPKSLIIHNKKSKRESDKIITIQTNDKTSKSYNPFFKDYTLIIIFLKPRLWVFPTLTNRHNKKLSVYSNEYTSLERESLQRRQFLNVVNYNQNSNPGQKYLEKIVQIGKEASSFVDPTFNITEWIIRLSAENRIENNLLTKDEKKLFEALKKIDDETDNLNKKITNRRYFKYSLNFRGLLLYLILINSEKLKFIDRDNEIFHNVFLNPNIIKIAPFLKSLNVFEKFGFKGKELAITIAKELRSQLHLDTRNGVILLERAIERYYKEVETYFYDLQLVKLSAKPEELEKYNILQNELDIYRKNMITILRDFIKYKERFFSFNLKEQN
jgi:hypothetical protein